MSVHLDLGCGSNKRPIAGYENIGIDIVKTEVTDYVLQLGFTEIPLGENSVDIVTAYDFLEHLPRVVFDKSLTHSFPYEMKYPFIFLMNDVYRVMKHGAKFIVECPFGDDAFNRDPTHVNRLGSDWYHYFQQNDNYYADSGLVKCNFKLEQNTFRRYKWTDKDIIHTELIAVKEEPNPNHKPTGIVNI